ncbi:hypothetical protein [Methylobacterium nigriterrae]|uniref:hypothetical protein n=1 Tax=Methylobacterium nigriterrae TaxID=3127512 RepID=UPI0030141A91
MDSFDHILNWSLKRGSHPFPGPDGGTCINEAAVVACGFPYRPVKSPLDLPECFSRPICRLALRLNDEAGEADRQRLMPFVNRLACADSPEVEARRAAYIRAHIDLDAPLANCVPLGEGIRILEGALAIGRQADPLGLDEVAGRMRAARGEAERSRASARPLGAKLKAWLGLPREVEEVG